MSQSYLDNLISNKKKKDTTTTKTTTKVSDPLGIKPSSNSHLAESELVEADKKAGSYDNLTVQPKASTTSTKSKSTKVTTPSTPSSPASYSDVPADPVIFDAPVTPSSTSSETPSASDSTPASSDAHTFVNAYDNLVSDSGNPNTYGINADEKAEYMTAFQTTPEIQQANAYLDEMLEKMRSGKTSFSDRLDSLISEYSSRDKFSYNPYADTLFQNQLSMAMNSGKQAMQDSMGQASALTGGYGSTYSQAVGNASYNQQIQNAYDNLPEYYNMALNQYQMEGDQMLQNIALVQDQDANEWQRLMNSYDAQGDAYNRAYNEARTAYTDRQNQLLNSMNMDNSNYWKNAEMEFNKSEAERNQSNLDRKFNENVRQFDVNDTWRRSEAERDQSNIDRNFEESVRQFDVDDAWRKSEAERDQSNLDRDFAEGVREFDSNQSYKYSALAQDAKQHDDKMAYKNSALAQDAKQFDATMALNRDKLEVNNSTPSGSTETVSKPTKSSSYDDIKSAYSSGVISGDEYNALIKDKYGINSSSIDKGVDAFVKGFKGVYGDDALALYIETYFGNAPEEIKKQVVNQIADLTDDVATYNVDRAKKSIFTK